MTLLNELKQKLIFVVGKGGVGRTTVSASIAYHYAQQGEKVLLVQWALKDAISQLYSIPACSHKESFTPHGYKTMNFSAAEAIKEYFVEHLKMKLIYNVVIENKHVQRLIHAAPGVQELFFLGRLFWLVELAEKEKGYSYDKVIVDSPATGHGLSLFGIAPAVANLGMTGPLAYECERVNRLLLDEEKTGVLVVTLPEELPIEESIETIPKITSQLLRPPLALIVNQSVNIEKFPTFNFSEDDIWFKSLLEKLKTDYAQNELKLILSILHKRTHSENKLTSWAKNQKDKKNNSLPVVSLPDLNIINQSNSHPQMLELLSSYF
ncbi:ArsA family ATPase [Pigmentibacter ruber]|uniref:ArsA family ATPase n=1 Tax=Pigmentibacter ruber TaxID=2683196 RepID=UPI00131BB857|nr:ArsA family ATPase [Pigmentibacter ruber]BFD31645.1 hypothetical protein GTC16762_12630 [Pigmentibacter ruber]